MKPGMRIMAALALITALPGIHDAGAAATGGGEKEILAGKCLLHDVAQPAAKAINVPFSIPALSGFGISEEQILSTAETITGRSFKGYGLSGICSCDEKQAPAPQNDNPPAGNDTGTPTGGNPAPTGTGGGNGGKR